MPRETAVTRGSAPFVVGAPWAASRTDGRGAPVCVIRTTEVRIQPLDQVDAAFAWDEGEGDRSLTYWRDAHIGFFIRMCAARGEVFGEEMETVLERFAMVWPTASPDLKGPP